jgi:hypothetical protein
MSRRFVVLLSPAPLILLDRRHRLGSPMIFFVLSRTQTQPCFFQSVVIVCRKWSRGMLHGFGIGAGRDGRWRQRIVDGQGRGIEKVSLQIRYIIVAL